MALLIKILTNIAYPNYTSHRSLGLQWIPVVSTNEKNNTRPIMSTGEELLAYTTMRQIESNIASNANKRINVFKILNGSVFNNIFATDVDTDTLLGKFGKAIRLQRALNRFARHFKQTHAHKLDIQTDLCGTDLSEIPAISKFIMYDDNTRSIYNFRISDLLRIIKTALCNSPSLFAEPLYPKNPYTNMPFTNAQLYNLYLHLRHNSTTIPIPIIFQSYIQQGLNLHSFLNETESVIREYAIQDIVRNASKTLRISYIIEMIDAMEYQVQSPFISTDFPKNILI